MDDGMNMETLKSIIGNNIVSLRRAARMTQLDLAEHLNYSDKAVSKWECGDAVPDILVLYQIANLFGVTLDYLTAAEHPEPVSPRLKHKARTHAIIISLSVLLVWLIATAIFVFPAVFGVSGKHLWMVFVYAIPVSSLVAFILCCLWGKTWLRYFLISLFVWSVLLTLYLIFTVYTSLYQPTAWLIFLLGIPGQAIILLWSTLKHRWVVRREQKKQGSENKS